MKVKIFQSMSEKKLEEKVNNFIGKSQIRITDIQLSSTVFFFSVIIVYENV